MRIPIIKVIDKCSGHIHILGTDRHDELVAEDNGFIGYYNLQNGCGIDDSYSFVTKDAGDGMLEFACEWVTLAEFQERIKKDPEHYLTPDELDERFPERKEQREKMLNDLFAKLREDEDNGDGNPLHRVK